MKIKSLLLGMMTCAALAACSNEDIVDNAGNQLEGDAYVAVKISNPASSFGRATAGGEDVGTTEENTINGATFVFFDAAGNYITNVQIGNSELKLSKDKQTSEAVLILKNATIEPTSVVAFLNAPAGLNMNQSMTALLASAGEYGYDATGNFVMSNSVFKNAGAVQVATPVAGHITTNAAAATANPVAIYVERVLSKVTVKKSVSLLTESTSTTIDGVSVELEPRITGWYLNATNSTSYVLKNVDESIAAAWAWGTNRSYWAKDVNYNGTTGLVLKPYTTTTTEPTEYCLENTFVAGTTGTVYTHLIVTAEIYNKTTNTAIGTFCSYNGAFYTEGDLKNTFVVGLTAYKKNDGSAITATDIKFVSADATSDKAYMAKAVFVDESLVSADVITALANKGKFMMYTDGKCYFWTAVEHTNPTAGETGAIGVVRNHSYELTLNKISGMGTPVVDPEKPIDPEKPTDDNSYLAATVNILSWKMVSQGVDLK